jgi:hypothetical protein
MTNKVLEQILAIQKSGVTNMFDVARVQDEAANHGFRELTEFLDAHKKEYCSFILTGKMED